MVETVVDTLQAVITLLPNGLNGFNSLELPESGPSSGEESLEGSWPVSPLFFHHTSNCSQLEKVQSCDIRCTQQKRVS